MTKKILTLLVLAGLLPLALMAYRGQVKQGTVPEGKGMAEIPMGFIEYKADDAGFRLSFQHPQSWRPQEETGTVERYQQVRLLGPRNREDTFSAVLSVAGFPTRDLGGGYEGLADFYKNYREHLPPGSHVTHTTDRPVAGQKAYDLTYSFQAPRIPHHHDMPKEQIQVRTRALFLQNGAYLYRISYSTDARDYDQNARVLERVLETLQFFPEPGT